MHKIHTFFTQNLKNQYNKLRIVQKTKYKRQSEGLFDSFFSVYLLILMHFSLVLVKGVTGFYRRLWNHLCFSHDVCIGRYHQNRQNLSAITFTGLRLKGSFARANNSFALAA